MDIVRLNPAQKNKAVQVLSSAFYDYPEFRFYFPDPERRSHYLPWYLGRVLDTAIHYGEVYTNPEVSGIAFILPPGHTRISQWEYIRRGFLPTPFVVGFKNFIRSQEGEEFISNEHEKIMFGRPHYYLWGLAVEPRRKHQGIGSALLEPVLAKADAEQMPVYLETHDEKNVAYYLKRGFGLTRMVRMPKYDLPVWCMVREPVQAEK
jgi:GNAT superfamily N-acetyltransferase